MYYLCEKYYKPITVQYYIADCVSWVPRITLLDLAKIGLTNTLLEQNSFVCKGLTVSQTGSKAEIKPPQSLKGAGVSPPPNLHFVHLSGPRPRGAWRGLWAVADQAVGVQVQLLYQTYVSGARGWGVRRVIWGRWPCLSCL